MSGSAASVLFPRRAFLAVVGDDDTFWLCRTAQIVYKDKQSFDIQWLEEVINELNNFW